MTELGNFAPRLKSERCRTEMCAFESASTGNPRQAPRCRSSVYWHAQLEQGENTVDCMVLDISAGGARVRAERRIGCHEAVTLRVGQALACRGCVAWCERDYIGIRFKDDAASVERMISDVLRRRMPSETPAYTRVSVSWDAELTVGGIRTRCRILAPS